MTHAAHHIPHSSPTSHAPVEVLAGDQGLADALKAATDEHHRRAEGQPFQRSLARGAASPAAVAGWLGQMTLVHAALETGLMRLIAAQPRLQPLFQPHQSRIEDLNHDLIALNAPSSGIPATPATAAMVEAIASIAAREDAIALLGPLYVLEGSQNGSRYIARALLRAWGWNGGRGPGDRMLRSLDPYGESQREIWQTFRTALNDLEVTDAQREAIIAGARATFDGITAMSIEHDR